MAAAKLYGMLARHISNVEQRLNVDIIYEYGMTSTLIVFEYIQLYVFYNTCTIYKKIVYSNILLVNKVAAKIYPRK